MLKAERPLVNPLQVFDYRKMSLDQLNQRVVSCKLCPRLVRYRCKVAKQRKRQFKNWDYWGRPVPSFGDPNPQLIIIGLAPAAHGGNRTGRVFTGDDSARFLMRGLYDAGFANQPVSEHRNDGLELIGAYITAAVKCAPPDNRPTRREIANCSRYLLQEMALLKSARTVLTLGRVAFQAYTKILAEEYGIIVPGKDFKHGARFEFHNLPTLFVSFHPSPRNTKTGKLTHQMFLRVLLDIRSHVTSRRANAFNAPLSNPS